MMFTVDLYMYGNRGLDSHSLLLLKFLQSVCVSLQHLALKFVLYIVVSTPAVT